MIDTPAITTTAEQPTAVIRLTIPRSEIQKEMGPAHQELFSTLAAQGVAPTGPWFSHHFRMDPATFDFNFYLLRFEQACNRARCTPEDLLT